MQNVTIDEHTAQTIGPTQVNYATLEAQVAEWKADFIQNMREHYGSAEADMTAAQLDANPWQALQWFVEDNIPAEQRNPGFLAPQEAVAALEVLASPEGMLTDSEEMAEVVAQLADQSPDLKGLEHLARCMSFLIAQGDFYPRAPRDFEQVAWDKAQGEPFMDGVTREAHGEAFGEFLAATAPRGLQ
ncbi:MAG: hypothetical protein ACTHOP_00655 [Mesorhizobium sp.]